MQQVETLWAELERLENERLMPYPDGDEGMTPFPGRLTGQGFFPGGDGLWRDDPKNTNPPPVPIGGILYLGNDFGPLETFQTTMERGYETDGKTWKNLKKRIEEAEKLNTGVCGRLGFYTNAVLGLRNSGGANDDRPWNNSSWWKVYDQFADSCRKFLEFQLETIKPRLVVILGPSPRFALCFPKSIVSELEIWKSKELSQIVPEKRIQSGVLQGRKITFLLARHPSWERANHRPELVAEDAQLLAKAWSIAQD